MLLFMSCSAMDGYGRMVRAQRKQNGKDSFVSFPLSVTGDYPRVSQHSSPTLTANPSSPDATMTTMTDARHGKRAVHNWANLPGEVLKCAHTLRDTVTTSDAARKFCRSELSSLQVSTLCTFCVAPSGLPLSKKCL